MLKAIASRRQTMRSNLWTAALLPAARRTMSDRAPSSGGNAKHNMPKPANARVAAPQSMAKTMAVVDISTSREPSWLSCSFRARRSTRLRWPSRQQPGEPRSVLGVMLLGVADYDQRIGGEQATQIAITSLADTAELFLACMVQAASRPRNHGAAGPLGT